MIRRPLRLPSLRLVLHAAALLAVLWLGGCATRSSQPQPERTVLSARTTSVPARIVANYFLVESPQIDGTTRRFLLDTGSSVNYVSEDLARTLRQRERGATKRKTPVRGANGEEVELEEITLRRLELGDAAFEQVPALLFDFAELSSHLGLRVDGLLGFPLFRDTRLTIDYPRAQLTLASPTAPPAPDGPGVSTLVFNDEQRRPLIPVQMGNESFVVLLDTGSDGSLSLNPAGLHPRFLSGPRPGTIVTSLGGNRHQQVGRIEQNLQVGDHTVAQPVVDLTDQLSALGGELLRHFTLTFDQRRNLVTFQRADAGPVHIASRPSTGLAFARSPAYWRVLTVIPDSPSSSLNVQTGDLVVRINGEPVARWDYERYAALLRESARITYTFLTGTREYEVEVPVFKLVP